jgi:hypothetical protein
MKADFNFRAFRRIELSCLPRVADQWETKVVGSHKFQENNLSTATEYRDTAFSAHQLGKSVAKVIDNIGSN